jgi:DNA-binding NarL/FixJ family response regulator
MTGIPLLVKDDFEPQSVSTQVDSLSRFSVNHAIAHVTQDVARLLQRAYSTQTDDNKYNQTITIRAIEPEYRKIFTVEPLTERELEVLQLIVDGHNNDGVARVLYISTGTVKTHVRNILKKLCAKDRTQAAIRALRSGLIH